MGRTMIARGERSAQRGAGRLQLPLGGLLLPLLVAWGCANHVRTVEHVDERERAKVIDVQHSFDTPEDLVRSPRLHVEVSVEEVLEARIERTVVTVEESTPYSPLRELYEVPLGAVSLPFALLIQVGDVLLLGTLPDGFVDGYSRWTVTALNPVMNVESSTRIEQRELDRDVRVGTPVRTVVRGPLEYYPIQVSFEGGAAAVVHTDKGGHAAVHLLDVASAGMQAPPRKLEIRLPETSLERTLFLDRRLTSRIWQARLWLEVLAKPDPTPEELVEAISAIDQLGFPRYSLEAEDVIHERFAGHREFLLSFRREIEKASPRAAPPVSAERPTR